MLSAFAAALLLSAAAVAAAAENPPPLLPPVAESVRKPPAPGAKAPRGKPGERKADVSSKAPRSAKKQPLPTLDEKNLGLGCAQP